MSNKLYFLVLSVFVFVYTGYAQWIPLDRTSIPGSKPNVQLISDSPSETIIKINLPGFYIKEFSSEGKTYQRIDIGDESISSQTGYPDLPGIAKVLAIPDNGTAEVEIIETGSVQKITGISIPPVRESWIEGKPETPYIENAGCYSSERIYPEKLSSIEDPAVFRDFRIARVSVFPIRYIPARHEIEAISSITIRVRYISGIGLNPKTTPHRPIAPSFAKLYRSFIFNYNEVLQRDYGGRETGEDLMLCITPDNFYNAFMPYADWKQKSGTLMHVTKFSEIGANASDPTIIKNFILGAYQNWTTPPTHVLIIGDEGYAPVQYVYYDWTFVNEDYFVELAGDDYFPELMIGRFTNQTVNGLQIIVNKDINYERFPYVEDESWYKRATVCSNNAYPSQVETKRITAEIMEQFGNFNVDTLMSDGTWSGSGCSMDLSDILTTINNGISYLNYRGEGWSDGWHANCYYFSTSDVNNLNNGAKLPFITSIGCGVAMFVGGESFGEKWLELGTTTAARGGCAFLGPTSNTHTIYNDAIDKGIYMGMFQEGMDSPGEAMMRGKLYMYEVFGNVYRVEYHYRIYCEIGDPSLHIWKNVPRGVAVNYPQTIPVGYSQSEVTVTSSLTGPVRDARVCISGENVNVVANTDINGIAILEVNAPAEDTLHITVCGGNVYPFEGSIVVVPAIENVAPLPDPAVTDTDGDNDGLIDPNENCTITFSLKNWGNTTSNNVTGELSLPDSVTYVNIVTTEPISYGNIAPGDSVQGTPFQFFIHPDCPVGFEIPFKLHITSSLSSWDYYITEVVHGCDLNFTEFVIDDSGNLLHNFRMDPGETVSVILNIQNTGDDTAPDIKGVLSSSDQYITVLDSVGNFESLLPDSSTTNESDVFIVKVSNNCPLQYNASYNIRLSTQNGNYPYVNDQTFVIPVAMPTKSDPTGPDSGGYYAFSMDDTLYQQAPVYNWIDITGNGTRITIPADKSDYTKTVDLPFTFKYYSNDYNQIRISTDGWIAFGSGTQTNSVNHALPYEDAVNNMAAAFWDDLYSLDQGETGKLYYYNDAANNRFIITWDQIGHVLDYTDRETFQIILLDPGFYPTTTGDGEIIMQYKQVEEPGSCTVGIENGAQDIGLTYHFDDLYDVTATEIQDLFAIKFTTMSPQIVSVNGDNKENIIPNKYSLAQNYPNPFNPSTRIRYTLPDAGHVTLKIYRIDGQLVKTIQDDFQPAGVYEKVWDGRNEHGTIVSSGVYFYRLASNDFVQVKKMILLK
ncbi:MAG TPA: C25 family cysteine peptidase [Ignavibacteriaceae bacterium]|nr:C25 family cysteine peptidase [Ignavibacteriaceae bacterium]